MPSLFDWSTTAASNTTVDGVSIAEGMSPANVNNGMRAIMSLVRQTFATALQNFLAGSAALPIANGGTAAVTASAALTALGGLSSTYRAAVPTTKTAAFTFALADEGAGARYTGGAADATINPVASTAYTVGAVILVRNAGSGVLTLKRGAAVVLKIGGLTLDQDVAVAVGGMCSLYHEATNTWVASGAGLT